MKYLHLLLCDNGASHDLPGSFYRPVMVLALVYARHGRELIR